MNKNAQLQAMETIIVSIILILLVLLGLWVYSSISIDETSSKQRSISKEQALDMATKLSYLPELKCPGFSQESRLCIDSLKAEILSSWLTDPQNPEYSDSLRLSYAALFGSRDIRILERYPNNDKQITLFDGAGDEGIAQRIPINLYDPNAKTIVLAEIEVFG